MKTLNLPGAALLFSAAVLFSLTGSLAAVGFSDDFETGYTVNEGLSDNDDPTRWDTNDPYDGANTGGSDGVITGYFTSGQSAFVGGLYLTTGGTPGRTDVTVTHPIESVTGDDIAFSADFAISSSTTGQAKDKFGFTFRIGNIEYATLLFTAVTQTVGDAGDDNFLNITVSSASGTSGILGKLAYDDINSLIMSIDDNDQFHASITGFNLTGSGIDVDPTDAKLVSNIDNVGVVWNLEEADPANAGSNAVHFDNVNVVPEPSTVGLSILAGMGGLGLILRRRKAA
jgi:hypothetical protein